jgi:hypothetical protein
MNNDKTGGAAFPHVSTHIARTGMTLRDYFAGQVISELLMRDEVADATSDFDMELSDIAAKLAYNVADAMIAEREKGGDQ